MNSIRAELTLVGAKELMNVWKCLHLYVSSSHRYPRNLPRNALQNVSRSLVHLYRAPNRSVATSLHTVVTDTAPKKRLASTDA